MLMTLAFIGCTPIRLGGDETGDTGDTGDLDTWPCGDGEGQVAGVVTVDGGVDESRTVTARDAAGDEYTGSTSPDDGSYSICLPPGTYDVYASAEGCDDSRDAEVVAREVTAIDLEIRTGCSTADKPNLYLYPSRPTRTEVRVEVDRRQRIFASDPPYAGGWEGVAMPDGRFVTGDDVAPFLFYEVTLLPRQVAPMQRAAGWCIEGEVPEAVAEMAAVLELYGFNAAEVDDFVEGWRLDLPRARAYGVFPQLSVDHAAGLDIQPPLPVDRLWLLVTDVGACDGALPAPAVVPFDRGGAHAVEWGVVLHDVAR
ncbi:MAG: carboxypeptidase regulatory-like domain-containing protein [Deltaproteobacteria bacterium]|nr:carboxypeptidase regulatory-like domain-containing protein [Deltaproteobacteria bacterium]